MRYRNNGAPFPRDDGSRWERGAVHEPTEHELRSRRHKLRPAFGRTGQVDQRETTQQRPDWPLKMQPELYLKLHKNGKHAALARDLIRGGD